MRITGIKKLFKREVIEKIIICIASLILINLIGAIYFTQHFFFNTVINGVNLSLKGYDEADALIRDYAADYELTLIERDGVTEKITGHDIGMQYNDKNTIDRIYKMQNQFLWIAAFFRKQNYNVKDLYSYDRGNLDEIVKGLTCLNNQCIESRNVSFQYSDGSYQVMKEVYGNILDKDKFREAVKTQMLHGRKELVLNEMQCYDNPKFTLSSPKTYKTKKILNTYVLTKITYRFGDNTEVLDGDVINTWLSVDENLDVHLNKDAVVNFIKKLSKRYDTVGVTRTFKTSTGKTIEVKGGLYGWKIDQKAEIKAIEDEMKHGTVITKEPVYSQTAVTRDDNEIGNTYIELNITKQHLWFYKDGKLVTQGSVVTGNPNRGNSTVKGVYMIVYKQKGATLKGPGYEAGVSYWMPFYGNIGVHDASWRSAFGGEIYKTKGTHGCVNAPFYLAKKIFENIEEGTPVISYEEAEE